MFVAISLLMNVVHLSIALVMILFVSVSHAEGPSGQLISSPVLNKALDAVRENRLQDAAKALSGFKYDSATLAQYHFVTARLKAAEKKPLEAIEHFSKAYQYAPSGVLKETALIERAESYIGLGYYYEARSSFNLFVRQYPASMLLGRAYTGLALSLAETGALKDALSYYEKSGSSPEVLIAKANILHRLAMTDQADRVYASVLDKNSSLVKGSESSVFYLGENYRLLGKIQEAEKWLKEVKDPLYKTKADLSLGRISLSQGKTDDAIKFFSSAVESKDRETVRQALLGMADASIKAGKTEEAKARLEEIRTKHPYGKPYDEAVLKLARLLINEGGYEQAGKYLGQLSVKSSLRREALEEYQRLLNEVRGKDKGLFIKLWQTGGPLLLDASREKFLLEAADDLRPAGKPFVDLMQYLSKYGTEAAKTKSYSALAAYYAEKNDMKRAVEFVGKLKSGKGTGEELLRLEARLAYVSRDYKSSAQKILQLKKLLPEDVKMLGRIVSADRGMTQAVARYERAVREYGGDASTYALLGDIAYDNNRHKDAITYYRLALSKDERYDWALYRIGSLTEGPEAEEALKKVSASDPVLSRLAEARRKEFELQTKGVGSYR